ncbi:MAG: mechanosensitive ion channel family protein [Treponema sp.]|jgi:small-conductance mechanosensitive channel|nr:mechanosensitive ion channel family protein [Treponema sp.]
MKFSLIPPLIAAALVLFPPVPLRAQDTPAGETGALSPETPGEVAPPAGETSASEMGILAGPGETLDVLSSVTGGIKERILSDETLGNYIGRLGIALGIIALQALLIWVFWRHIFKFITKKMVGYLGPRTKPFTIKKLRILSTAQILNLVVFGIKIIKYIFTAIQLLFTIPLIFSLFPLTRDLASTLFSYIITPFKNIVLGTISYIPNLITIAVIIVVTRYVLRGLKFFTLQIERGRLVLPGFYSDWANPTFNILRVLLYAFTVAIIYPYLPGSDSRIFQGVSVLVGLIFSMGSSSAIGNLVAGLVVTYMRPFKIGDRIKINDVTGFVVEKTLMVIRLKTHKNEYVTFPNMMILNNSIVNYHTSSDEDEEGLILNTTITFGYGTPWQTVHEVLINAALATPHVLEKPAPFVLQTAMNDFYAAYQINFYTKEVDMVPRIYSNMYQNIQNGFHAAGIDMTAPHFRVNIPYQSPAETFPPPKAPVSAAPAPKAPEEPPPKDAAAKISTPKAPEEAPPKDTAPKVSTAKISAPKPPKPRRPKKGEKPEK